MVPKFEEGIESVDGIPLRSDEPGYRPDELLSCGRCRRTNPPNRLECLYCGDTLVIDGEGAKKIELKVRELEAWEKGFNIVLLGKPDSTIVDDIASLFRDLGIDDDLIKRILEFESPTPIVRVPTEAAGNVVAERVAKSGSNIAIVSDEDLRTDTHPIRLRSCSIEKEKLVLTTFNTNEEIEFPLNTLRAIVTGMIIETHSEKTLKKKKGNYLGSDDAVVSSDAGATDLYFEEEANGFRIMTSGFDFSSLGDAKSILAADNLKLLVSRLEELSPNAKIFSDYQVKRKLLDSVWPCKTQNESKGFVRSGFGVSLSKGEFTSNVEQFTKYSRLVQRTL